MEGQAIATTLGLGQYVTAAWTGLARTDVRLGHLDAARAHAEHALDEARQFSLGLYGRQATELLREQ